MENELIIDGQVIGLSETQENAEETIIQTESQPENESRDDNGKEVATEPEKTEETPEDYALRIGDEEIQLNADDDDHIDGQPAPQWVKDLRKGFKETQKENRELRRQLEEALAKPAEHQQPQPDAIPPKPTLESCDYDEQAFEQALTDWHEKKRPCRTAAATKTTSATGIPTAFPAKGRSA